MPLDNNLLATPGDVAQFAVPGAFLDDYSGRFFQSRQISSINKFLHRSADHLFRSPTIQTLGAATPVANAVVQFADLTAVRLTKAFRDKSFNRLPDRLGCRAAEYFLGRSIEKDDALGIINSDDAVYCRV